MWPKQGTEYCPKEYSCAAIPSMYTFSTLNGMLIPVTHHKMVTYLKVFACHEIRVAGKLKALALLGPVSEDFSARSGRLLSLRTPLIYRLPQSLMKYRLFNPSRVFANVRRTTSDTGCSSLLESASNKVMEGGRPGAYTLKMSSTVVLLLLGPPHNRLLQTGDRRPVDSAAFGPCLRVSNIFRKSADETEIHTVMTRSSSLPHQRSQSW